MTLGNHKDIDKNMQETRGIHPVNKCFVSIRSYREIAENMEEMKEYIL